MIHILLVTCESTQTGVKMNSMKVEHISSPKRQASIEMLRSIAMLMVITLHYLDKGAVLRPLTEIQGFYGYLPWFIESLSIVAVNTYVLVSGYFLLESGFRLKRLVNLVGQVLFYSLAVPVILVLGGVISIGDLTIYNLLFYVFPVQMNHYWFATSYIMLYILLPVLALGVKQLSKAQLKTTILLLLTVFSISKTVLPFLLEIDKKGYDVIWFICLFLIAGYIRLYGLPNINSSKKGFLLYGIGSILTFASIICLAGLSKRLGKFEYFILAPLDYNHILCLVGAVGLFLGFLHWNLKEGMLSRIFVGIGPYTFGVYLLHENIDIRYLWPQWLKVESFSNSNWLIIHWLVSILLVFVVGITVDFIRAGLFKIIGRCMEMLWKKEKI